MVARHPHSQCANLCQGASASVTLCRSAGAPLANAATSPTQGTHTHTVHRVDCLCREQRDKVTLTIRSWERLLWTCFRSLPGQTSVNFAKPVKQLSKVRNISPVHLALIEHVRQKREKMQRKGISLPISLICFLLYQNNNLVDECYQILISFKRKCFFKCLLAIAIDEVPIKMHRIFPVAD